MIDFSIVIPTYNNLDLFIQAYDSIKEQKNISFEIIVTDDSNIDIIALFIKSLKDERIIYKLNTPSLGAVKNWNAGISMASGKYIILMHHDEFFADRLYYLMNVKKLFYEKEFKIIVSNIKIDNQNHSKKISRIPGKLKYLILNYCPSFLFFCNIIGPTSSIAFINEKVIFFDSNLKWLVDIDWYYSLLSLNKTYVEEKLLICSTDNPNQITKSINVQSLEITEKQFIINKYNKISVFIFLNLRRIVYKFKINLLLKPLIWNNQ